MGDKFVDNGNEFANVGTDSFCRDPSSFKKMFSTRIMNLIPVLVRYPRCHHFPASCNTGRQCCSNEKIKNKSFKTKRDPGKFYHKQSISPPPHTTNPSTWHLHQSIQASSIELLLPYLNSMPSPQTYLKMHVGPIVESTTWEQDPLPNSQPAIVALRVNPTRAMIRRNQMGRYIRHHLRPWPRQGRL
mmetsp:Transcript_15036/g.30736  ORF Transcript_15036/g.30736 Transcript_15036/m.30736 type:complete len:187 (+) Transcript_15036:265-825(+)